jgi:hypothetical protein
MRRLPSSHLEKASGFVIGIWGVNMFTPQVHRAGYLRSVRDQYVFCKYRRPLRDGKGGALPGKKFNNNQDEDSDREHIDKSGCVRNSRDD